MDVNELQSALDAIPVQECTYTEWIGVGMALKDAGLPCDMWERWSAGDPAKYHPGECARKWPGFHGRQDTGITISSIFWMASTRGWRYEGKALGWGEAIAMDSANRLEDGVLVDQHWVEDQPLEIPEQWAPGEQLAQYLKVLFEPGDHVAYVVQSFDAGDRRRPGRGSWGRTAEELLAELERYHGDVRKALGDYDADIGAWICFNPVDGQGRADRNITEYRYALVESDALELGKQLAIIHQLQLPCAAIVYSGGKSVHAIVHIDAPDAGEYRKRVNYLYEVCQRNGMQLDQQNRNPSRLSRMPGVTRAGQKQYLLETNAGLNCWQAWQDWVEAETDDLPNTESLASVWDDLPPLAPALIEGVLRQGHKMLISGPSKAGKSFALIELCICIAEGAAWLGRWPCAQGRVLYINLELDRASCLHRFRDVYSALGLAPKGLQNIEIWNLRGAAVPMDKLAPKLIRRAKKKGFLAIVLDPIYKVITGDENSADQMARFCNQFDMVCRELRCAVIYCHHHSKGAQGDKRSVDRAAGSGVFARDPDAILDLIGLDVDEAIRAVLEDKLLAAAARAALDQAGHAGVYGPDDALSRSRMQALCAEYLPQAAQQRLDEANAAARKRAAAMTAWRIEGTLREFARFEPVDLWFDYPVHVPDTGMLQDMQPDRALPLKGAALAQRRWGGKAKQTKDRAAELENAYNVCRGDGKVTVYAMAEFMALKPETVRKRLKADGRFWVDDDKLVGMKAQE